MSVKQFHVVLSALLIVILCITPVPTTRAQSKRLLVITSTTILLDVAQNVAGDLVELSSLVPSDGDVHEFEPRPEDIRRIADADLVVINGVGLEPFIEKLVADSGTKASVIQVSRGAPVRRAAVFAFASDPSVEPAPDGTPDPSLPDGAIGRAGMINCDGSDSQQNTDADHHLCDPHLWQDPTNVIIYAQNIRDAFTAADPANADAYKVNADAYIAKLNALDLDINAGINKIPVDKRILVTDHDALSYFASRYGLKIVPILLRSGGSADPTPQELASLIDFIKAQQVPAIFTENIGSTKLADSIASQTGVKIVQSLYTDALGGAGTPGETYLGMMRYNLDAITSALGAK